MTHVEQLVNIYLESKKRLLDEIRKRALWGRSTWQQEELLRLIDAELQKLNLEAFAWADEAIEHAYMRGARLAWQAAHTADSSVKAFGSFGGLHKPAIRVLAQNAKEFFLIANNLIARQAQDTVRKVGVEVVSRKFAEMLTVRETSKLMEQRLEEEGFGSSVPWRNGRGSMRTDSYAKLVARTTTREAQQTAIFDQMEAMGHHLYKMTSHSPTCKVCAPRQGRVYRTVDFPADDPRQAFPHISEGFPRWPTYKTVHPNCAHLALGYIWNQKSKAEQQAALKRAGEPFDHDPRSEAERARYEKIQRENAERLRDRKQWEKYRAVLSKENVPSFSGFRAMKKAGSLNYQRLQFDYRFEGKYGATRTNPPLENNQNAYGIFGKLSNYTLDDTHPKGKHKAIVFQSALGYNCYSAEALEKEIKAALPMYRAVYKGDNGYGKTYQVTALIAGIGEKAGTYQPVVTTWEYSNLDREKPRMVTCYVSKTKRP